MSDQNTQYTVGDKVMCIDDNNLAEHLSPLFSELIIKGWVYVVESIRVVCYGDTVQPVIDLRGITADLTEWGTKPGWTPDRFRPLGSRADCIDT